MKERPILFKGPMVRALLAGTKTQTRRVVNPSPMMVEDHRCAPWDGNPSALMLKLTDAGQRCPYGQPGDRLWVRETFALPDRRANNLPPWAYAADYADRPQHAWKPSIHMPRAASRITLEITGIRVEQLQDISDDDLEQEGLQEVIDAGIDHDGFPRDAYRALWDSINGAGSWGANPWVWVVMFKRLEGGAA